MAKYNAQREMFNLEFKEDFTKSYLKTVSAFANYQTGKIVFGVADDGEIVKLNDPKQLALNLENTINDSISPVPNYSIEIVSPSGPIELTVKEGRHKPYYYRAKAYRRNDSDTIEVSRSELEYLILEGLNLTYDELDASTQELTFDYLSKEFKERVGLKSFNMDTLRTLGLYVNGIGFNRAAELLADKNRYPGTDVVRFGDNISVILDRKTSDHESILEAFENAMEMYRHYYQYEVIEGEHRETKELIPEPAFREAIANALIHRQWNVQSTVQVSMYGDRVEITSPGGLPDDLTEEDYWNREISVFRQPILADIFNKLGLIERYGTGTLRIKMCYEGQLQQPHFEQSAHFLTITLPTNELPATLSSDEKMVLALFSTGKDLTRNQIQALTGFEKNKAIRALNSLIAQGFLTKNGEARATKYKRAE